MTHELLSLLERSNSVLFDRRRRRAALAPLEEGLTLKLRAMWLREATLVLRAYGGRAEWTRQTGLSEAEPGGSDFGMEAALTKAQAELAPGFGQALNTAAGGAIEAGAAALAQDIGGGAVSFSVKHPDAVRYLAAQGADRVTAINATTRRFIRAEVKKAVANGTSYETVARRIIARYAEFGAPSPLRHIRSRAELVAVTEMGDAYTFGTMTTARGSARLGIPMEKHWLTVGDERVDDAICRTNEASGWIPLEEPFPSGHDAPTGHPGCRCDVQTRQIETTPSQG